MSYQEVKDLVKHKRGPATKDERQILEMYLRDKSRFSLLIKFENLRKINRNKVQQLEFEIINEILLEQQR